MQIIRNSEQTEAGSAESFTGRVYMEALATPSASSSIGAFNVHFAPGARTAWHTHPSGQTLFVTVGVGLCQRRGGPVETILAGDRVFFEPGEEHWHGAAPGSFMSHIAMQTADGSGALVSWGEPVSDEEYGAAS